MDVTKFIKKNSTLVLLLLVIIAAVLLKVIVDKEQIEEVKKPNYHFYYIGKNSVDPYWNSIEEGVRDASEDFGVAVEYSSPKFSDVETHVKLLDIGILSKVDGIITYGYLNSDFTELINKADEVSIPLVTVESDNKISKRNAFIGTSSYRLGEEAAKLLVKATEAEGEVFVMRNSDSIGNSLDEKLKINGFVNILDGYDGLKLVDVDTLNLGDGTTESILDKALSKNPNITAIYTPNSIETIEAAKYIVDENLVGDVIIIGIGNSKEAIHYIKRGIIYGTVMSDPYLMGYKSIEMLIQVSEDKNISAVADTGLKINTLESVLEEELQEEDEANPKEKTN